MQSGKAVVELNSGDAFQNYGQSIEKMSEANGHKQIIVTQLVFCESRLPPSRIIVVARRMKKTQVKAVFNSWRVRFRDVHRVAYGRSGEWEMAAPQRTELRHSQQHFPAPTIPTQPLFPPPHNPLLLEREPDYGIIASKAPQGHRDCGGEPAGRSGAWRAAVRGGS